jgi:hypothetical protein
MVRHCSKTFGAERNDQSLRRLISKLHMFRDLAYALLLFADKDLHQLSENLTPRQVFDA